MNETFSQIVKTAERAVAGSEVDRGALPGLLDGFDLADPGEPGDRAYLAFLLDWIGMRQEAMVALGHAGADPGNHGAEMANLAGLLVVKHGDYERAYEHFRRALSSAGDGVSLRAKVLVNLAALSMLEGDVDMASAWLAQVDDAHMQVSDPADNVLLASIRFSIARARSELPQLRRAVTQLNEATRTRVAELGSYHPLALTAVASLAAADFDLATAEGSVEKQGRAIAVLEIAAHRLAAELGANHPQALASLENLCIADLRLALTHGSIDQARQAVSALNSTSQRMIDAVGRTHPQALAAWANAASARVDLNKSLSVRAETLLGLPYSITDGERVFLAALGSELRQWREIRALTRKELATLSGVSGSTISRIEQGTIHAPRLGTLTRLADALELTGQERVAFLAAGDPRTSFDRTPSVEPAAAAQLEAGTLTSAMTLPPDTVTFSGRTAESELLKGSEAGSVIIVHGMAGSGKTALAVHVAHVIRERFPDGVLFLNLRAHVPGMAPLTANDALRSLVLQLGVRGEGIPARQADRQALYRSVLEDKRALIVLDDASAAEQVIPLLPGADDCMLIVTSRTRLSGLDAPRILALELAP